MSGCSVCGRAWAMVRRRVGSAPLLDGAAATAGVRSTHLRRFVCLPSPPSPFTPQQFQQPQSQQHHLPEVLQQMFHDGDPRFAYALNNQGETKRRSGELQESLKILLAAKMFFEERSIQDSEVRSCVLNNLGLVYMDMMQFSNALPHLEESLKLRESRPEDKQSIVDGHNNIGLAHVQIGHNEKADRHFQSAMQMAKEHNLYVSPSLIANYGLLKINTKEYERSLELSQDALRLLPAGDSDERASVLNNLGLANYHLKRLNKAHEWFAASIEMFQRIYGADHSKLYSIYVNMSSCCGKMKGSDRAREGRRYLQQAKEIANRLLAAAKQPA